ncbi:MAG: hypothetical protein SGPRY_012389, partial [Prymnesium sp.]
SIRPVNLENSFNRGASATWCTKLKEGEDRKGAPESYLLCCCCCLLKESSGAPEEEVVLEQEDEEMPEQGNYRDFERD